VKFVIWKQIDHSFIDEIKLKAKIFKFFTVFSIIRKQKG